MDVVKDVQIWVDWEKGWIHSATKLSVYISFVSRYTSRVDCTQMRIFLELPPTSLRFMGNGFHQACLPALHGVG